MIFVTILLVNNINNVKLIKIIIKNFQFVKQTRKIITLLNMNNETKLTEYQLKNNIKKDKLNIFYNE